MAARKPHRSESEGPPDGGAGSPPIFVCDASAEAERLMTTLRNRGHPTVDVPIGMLPSRVRYGTPALVVCDADAHEALRRVLEMHELSTSKVKLLFVGHDDGALRHEPEFRRLATATLTRPLNLAATADLVESIVGRPAAKTTNKGPQRRKRAPVLVASARKPYRSDVDALPGSQCARSTRRTEFERAALHCAELERAEFEVACAKLRIRSGLARHRQALHSSASRFLRRDPSSRIPILAVHPAAFRPARAMLASVPRRAPCSKKVAVA